MTTKLWLLLHLRYGGFAVFSDGGSSHYTVIVVELVPALGRGLAQVQLVQSNQDTADGRLSLHSTVISQHSNLKITMSYQSFSDKLLFN